MCQTSASGAGRYELPSVLSIMLVQAGATFVIVALIVSTSCLLAEPVVGRGARDDIASDVFDSEAHRRHISHVEHAHGSTTISTSQSDVRTIRQRSSLLESIAALTADLPVQQLMQLSSLASELVSGGGGSSTTTAVPATRTDSTHVRFPDDSSMRTRQTNRIDERMRSRSSPSQFDVPRHRMGVHDSVSPWENRHEHARAMSPHTHAIAPRSSTRHSATLSTAPDGEGEEGPSQSVLDAERDWLDLFFNTTGGPEGLWGEVCTDVTQLHSS